MRSPEIEAWALNVIERVKNKQPIEDSRVELKSDWPHDASKTARRIAAHANAARGEPILWLIGVGEESVTGVAQIEIAEWYGAIKSWFDGVAPDLTDLNLAIASKAVAALLFQTSRAPFVVRNPAFGKPEGGPVEFEVPWREHTAVRTAGRNELLRLLLPVGKLPLVELLGAKLVLGTIVTDSLEQLYCWTLDMRLYMVPQSDAQVVIPFHKCQGTFAIPSVVSRTPFSKFGLQPSGAGPLEQPGGNRNTGNELILRDPGMVRLSARATTPTHPRVLPNPAAATVDFRPVNSGLAMTISVELGPDSPRDDEKARWVLRSSPGASSFAAEPVPR